MSVLLCSDIDLQHLYDLISRYGMRHILVKKDADIPGSFWLPPEAGLIGNTLYIRYDTPVHSALHETCHYICMDSKRRANLHTDAGGRTAIEEDSVCYLQILLSDYIPGMQRERMLSDMDEWGYSFRLGSAKAWFEQDAEDALIWLQQNKLVHEPQQISFLLRQ